MKVIQINMTHAIGSTGNIVKNIENAIKERNWESFVGCGNLKERNDNIYKIGTDAAHTISIIKTRLLGRHGFYNKRSTKKFLEWVDNIKPDIIHLHNIHGNYINVKLLFEYLKAYGKSVVWTLHDCWSFTGNCAYYDYVQCDKWKSMCHDCEQLDKYPITLFFDRSRQNYGEKKRLFTSIDNMTLVTPSNWLAEQVESSFLNKYSLHVIHNGIDRNIFKPTLSDIRQRYSIGNRFIVLGVSFGYNERKGLQYFNRLAEKLGNEYAIVIVGIKEDDKCKFADSIITITKTNNTKEMAQIYSAADVFVNPTLEDNFPTTNLEALACGTPVITFQTGGSPECINKTCGMVIEKGNFEKLTESIVNICTQSPFTRVACVTRSDEFDSRIMTNKYCDLYGSLNKI